MPKTYFNLLLRYDKKFQYFLEGFVKLLLSSTVYSVVGIIYMSAEICNKIDVLFFIKRCDALNFEFSINSFFEFLYFPINTLDIVILADILGL